MSLLTLIRVGSGGPQQSSPYIPLQGVRTKHHKTKPEANYQDNISSGTTKTWIYIWFEKSSDDEKIELNRRIQLADKDGAHIYETLRPTGCNDYYLLLHETGAQLINSQGHLKTLRNVVSAIKAANEIGAN